LKILWGKSLSDCPECVAKKKKAILAKQAASGETEISTEIEMPVEGEFPLKFDISTKNFICKKCGLYLIYLNAIYIFVFKCISLLLW